MMDSTIQISGLDQLSSLLGQLPAKMEANILRGALRAGMNVIRDEARRYVPVDSGELRKSIRVSARIKGGKVYATLKAGNREAFYAHMIEFGHFVRNPGEALKGGRRSRAAQRAMLRASGAQFVSARPFLRPALDSKSSESVVAVADYIRGRLEKEGLLALESDGGSS